MHSQPLKMNNDYDGCSVSTRSVSPLVTPTASETIDDENVNVSGAGAAPNRRMSLRKSLSFKKQSGRNRSGSFGSKGKSSLFASFSSKKTSNVVGTSSSRRLQVLDISEAGSDSIGTSDNDHVYIDHAKTENGEEGQATTKAGVGEQDVFSLSSEQDDEADDDELPTEDVPSSSPSPYPRRGSHGAFSRSSTGDFSRTTSASFDEVEGVTITRDSAIMLSRLGADATDDEMAEVASLRAQESINDCFSIAGAGLLDRCSFDKIPSYAKDELLMGQHLGKGSFSDVFEVTVMVRDPVGDAPIDELIAAAASKTTSNTGTESVTLPTEPPLGHRRPARQRRHSMSSSICVGSLGSRAELPVSGMRQGKRLTLAMKCLRPQARSNFEHFLVGVEDLVHETAILSSLDHPNIIKLHGRAGDNSSFKLSDGYFILVDRLQDTLQEKINRWAKSYPNSRKNAPSLNQVKVACALSDALSYLHLSNVVFRDLKPANVGFDSSGTLKLFDFGFAVSVRSDTSQEPRLLHDKCGTLRYMAPEVGLGQGYGMEVDVYSFGILLWEICALKKPFSSVKSADDFESRVFDKGDRPKLGKYWPKHLTDTLQSCWSSDPTERPTMQYVKSMLTASLHELKSHSDTASGIDSLKKSFVMTKRLTWNV